MDDSPLVSFAHRLNAIARLTIEEDGEHAAMYFLAHADGRVETRMFEEEDAADSVGAARARQLADAVRATDADAVVMVSEAWSAESDDVPESGRVRDASPVDDVLLLVGVDRSGETVVLESPVLREADGRTRVGETTLGEGWQVATLDGVRAAWGLLPDR